MLVRPILVEVLKRDRYRRLRSGGRRDSGVDVSDLHGLGNAPHGCRGCGWSSCPPCSIEVLVNVVRVEHILAVKNDVFPFGGADMLQETDAYGAPLPRRAVNKHPQIKGLSMEPTLLRCDWISRRAAMQRSLLQILGLNVRKKGIALMAAGDLVGDDLDTILDQYRVQSSTLGILTEYLAGEKDSTLNLNNLKKQLKEAA